MATRFERLDVWTVAWPPREPGQGVPDAFQPTTLADVVQPRRWSGFASFHRAVLAGLVELTHRDHSMTDAVLAILARHDATRRDAVRGMWDDILATGVTAVLGEPFSSIGGHAVAWAEENLCAAYGDPANPDLAEPDAILEAIVSFTACAVGFVLFDEATQQARVFSHAGVREVVYLLVDVYGGFNTAHVTVPFDYRRPNPSVATVAVDPFAWVAQHPVVIPADAALMDLLWEHTDVPTWPVYGPPAAARALITPRDAAQLLEILGDGIMVLNCPNVSEFLTRVRLDPAAHERAETLLIAVLGNVVSDRNAPALLQIFIEIAASVAPGASRLQRACLSAWADVLGMNNGSLLATMRDEMFGGVFGAFSYLSATREHIVEQGEAYRYQRAVLDHLVTLGSTRSAAAHDAVVTYFAQQAPDAAVSNAQAALHAAWNARQEEAGELNAMLSPTAWDAMVEAANEARAVEAAAPDVRAVGAAAKKVAAAKKAERPVGYCNAEETVRHSDKHGKPRESMANVRDGRLYAAKNIKQKGFICEYCPVVDGVPTCAMATSVDAARRTRGFVDDSRLMEVNTYCYIDGDAEGSQGLGARARVAAADETPNACIRVYNAQTLTRADGQKTLPPHVVLFATRAIAKNEEILLAHGVFESRLSAENRTPASEDSSRVAVSERGEPFEVGHSAIPGAGLGLFAGRFFPAGSAVIPYTGTHLTRAEYRAMKAAYLAEHGRKHDMTYIYQQRKYTMRPTHYEARKARKGTNPHWKQEREQINQSIYVDASADYPESGFARYINDPTRPEDANLVMREQPELMLHATRDIRIGEELLWDYGPEYWKHPRDDPVEADPNTRLVALAAAVAAHPPAERFPPTIVPDCMRPLDPLLAKKAENPHTTVEGTQQRGRKRQRPASSTPPAAESPVLFVPPHTVTSPAVHSPVAVASPAAHSPVAVFSPAVDPDSEDLDVLWDQHLSNVPGTPWMLDTL